MVPRSPTSYRLDRSGNVSTAVGDKALFELPHRALSRESYRQTESHPFHQTQELPDWL
jgi:hypothetical protein